MPQPPSLAVEIEREEDGRWLAEVPAVPGALLTILTFACVKSKSHSPRP